MEVDQINFKVLINVTLGSFLTLDLDVIVLEVLIASIWKASPPAEQRRSRLSLRSSRRSSFDRSARPPAGRAESEGPTSDHSQPHQRLAQDNSKHDTYEIFVIYEDLP